MYKNWKRVFTENVVFVVKQFGIDSTQRAHTRGLWAQKLLLSLSEAVSLVLRSSRRASSSDDNAFNLQIQYCWTKQCRSCFAVRVVLRPAKSPGAYLPGARLEV